MSASERGGGWLHGWRRRLPGRSEPGSGSRVGRTCVPPGVFCAPLDLTAAVQPLTTHARTHARGGATTSYSQQRVWPHMSRLRTAHPENGCRPPVRPPARTSALTSTSPPMFWAVPRLSLLFSLLGPRYIIQSIIRSNLRSSTSLHSLLLLLLHSLR